MFATKLNLVAFVGILNRSHSRGLDLECFLLIRNKKVYLHSMKKQEIKIGMWYTYCCHLDLQQIKDEQGLEEVVDSLSDYDLPAEVWQTRKEALLQIRSRWDNIEVIKEIDSMLLENGN